MSGCISTMNLGTGKKSSPCSFQAETAASGSKNARTQQGKQSSSWSCEADTTAAGSKNAGRQQNMKKFQDRNNFPNPQYPVFNVNFNVSNIGNSTPSLVPVRGKRNFLLESADSQLDNRIRMAGHDPKILREARSLLVDIQDELNLSLEDFNHIWDQWDIVIPSKNIWSQYAIGFLLNLHESYCGVYMTKECRGRRFSTVQCSIRKIILHSSRGEKEELQTVSNRCKWWEYTFFCTAGCEESRSTTSLRDSVVMYL